MYNHESSRRSKNYVTRKITRSVARIFYGKQKFLYLGDISAKILFVGLAPAAHGGTRTGRVFTGDKSSNFLYKPAINSSIAWSLKFIVSL